MSPTSTPAAEPESCHADLVPWGPRAQLVLLLGLAWTVRFGLAAGAQCIHSDGPEYVKVATWFGSGQYEPALSHPYQPLYPILLALTHAVVADWELAGMAVSAALSGLAVIPLFLLTRRAFGGGAAAAAGLLYAFHPYVQLSVHVATTGTYLFWVLWSMDLADRARRGAGAWAAGAAGLCATFAYLTRPDGLFLYAAAGAAVALGGGGVRRLAPRIAAILLAGMVVMVPYCAWLHAVTGSWLPTAKLHRVPFGLHQAGEDWPLFTEHQRRIAQVRGSPPAWQALAGVGRTAWEAARAQHLPGLFLPVGILLWWRTRKRAPAPGNGALLLFPVVFLLALAWFSVVTGRESKRYTVPIAMMTLAWSGAGLAGLAGLAARRAAGAPRLVAVAAVLVLSFWALRPPGADKRGERLAGLWIREHARASRPRILSRMDRVAFYAQGPYLPIVSHEALTAQRLLARIDADRPDYLVADRHLEEIFPGFFAWAETAGNERLELVYETSKSAPGGEEPVRVFEVLRR